MRRIGRDKYITGVVEGQLSFVPRQPSQRKARVTPKRATPKPKHFKGGRYDHLPDECPGWAKWRSVRRAEDTTVMPRGTFGRPVGSRHGVTKAQREKELMNLNSLFHTSDEEMQEIVKVINAEPDVRTRVVMRDYFKLIFSKNCAEREKQHALKTILEFTKAKPAVKSEVTLDDKTADEWTSNLLEFEDGKDDWTSTKRN